MFTTYRKICDNQYKDNDFIVGLHKLLIYRILQIEYGSWFKKEFEKWRKRTDHDICAVEEECNQQLSGHKEIFFLELIKCKLSMLYEVPGV